MTSPLLPYANAYLLLTQQGAPEVVDGRVVTTAGTRYLVRCYLKRQDSAGTTTGADYLPTQFAPGQILPGASGEVYLYRGYALQYAAPQNSYNPYENRAIPAGLFWTSLAATSLPQWLHAGADCIHLHGNETPKTGRIEVSTGGYGGSQIDEIISQYIVGVPIAVRSGELTG